MAALRAIVGAARVSGIPELENNTGEKDTKSAAACTAAAGAQRGASAAAAAGTAGGRDAPTAGAALCAIAGAARVSGIPELESSICEKKKEKKKMKCPKADTATELETVVLLREAAAQAAQMEDSLQLEDTNSVGLTALADSRHSFDCSSWSLEVRGGYASESRRSGIHKGGTKPRGYIAAERDTLAVR